MRYTLNKKSRWKIACIKVEKAKSRKCKESPADYYYMLHMRFPVLALQPLLEVKYIY